MRSVSQCHRRPFAPLRRSVVRSGFTLVELLVVIGIILLVGAITLSAVNLTISGDRVRGAARQVQSYLEGARSRAVYGGNIAAQSKGAVSAGDAQGVGVRFIREPNSSLVSSFVYIQQVTPYSSLSNNQTISIGNGAEKRSLNFAANTALDRIPRELVPSVAEIYISDDNSFEPAERYRVIRPSASGGSWMLTSDYIGVGTGPFPNRHFKIRLLAEPMPNQEPRSLGNGVVIDLRHSRIPISWRAPTGWSDRLDLMFDSTGTVKGEVSAMGMIEFYVTDRSDALLFAPPCAPFWSASRRYYLNDMVAPFPTRTDIIYQATQVTGGQLSGASAPAWTNTPGATIADNEVTWTCVAAPDGCSNAKKDRLVVSLMPQTGATAVHPVYVSLPNEDADPFRYAESGETARQ